MKGAAMRKTNQAGYIMRHRGWSVLRYRERVGVGGELKMVQRDSAARSKRSSAQDAVQLAGLVAAMRQLSEA